MSAERVAGVSVIIPARNAAQVLPRALVSLAAQTYRRWEAIVIDDGSTDDTAEVAARWADSDHRIRLIRRPQEGVSAARNAGIREATQDWLLFLDSDDELLPAHLERMSAVLQADATLEAAVCGWAFVGPSGKRINRPGNWNGEEIFFRLTRGCVFAIHTCVVRAEAVRQAGGFDVSLPVGEDWDLWQRLARRGVRFGHTPEVLALYYLRPDSASLHPPRIYEAGLRVITTGHGSDARVKEPAPKYAAGSPGQVLPAALWNFAFFCAGLGSNTAILKNPELGPTPELDPITAAECLTEGLIVATIANPPAGGSGWDRAAARIIDCMRGLPAPFRTPGFLRPFSVRVFELLLSSFPDLGRLAFDDVVAVRIEAFRELPSIEVESASRAECVITVNGEALGSVTAPVIAGRVQNFALAAQIADRFAWEILGRFFQESVYPQILAHPVRRHVVTGIRNLPPGDLHDQIGWTVLLQEQFGKRGWPRPRFYVPWWPRRPQAAVPASGVVLLEASKEFRALRSGPQGATVVFTIGGAVVASFRMKPRTRVSPDRLRRTLLDLAGFELCRAAVQQGLVGRPADSSSLRNRLQSVASNPDASGAPFTASEGLTSTPAVARMAAEAGADGPALVIPMQLRHGTGAGRRFAIPAGAAAEAAASIGCGLVSAGKNGYPAQVAVVCADLIPPDRPALQDIAESAAMPRTVPKSFQYDRAWFEHLFSSAEDPWRYDNDYERVKYEQTMSLVPAGISSALELACAEGHFTARLAAAVGEVTATDISEIALERAARRCANLANVRFSRLDFFNQPVPGTWDLIICSEVLYYTANESRLREVALKMADAIRPGGWLLTAHANQTIDASGEPAFDWGLPFGAVRIGEIMAGCGRLHLEREIRTSLYRVQLFRAGARSAGRPQIIEAATANPLPPEIAAMVRHPKSASFRGAPEPVTRSLPILMYHRVAPACAAGLSRYCLTPARFAEQMQYLHESGHYTISFETWRRAAETRRPLPGRAVILTFDDGYRDFHEHAMPILEKYGFSATVFLVTDHVGETNRWDSHLETVPLLTWGELRQLRERGIAFGAHTRRHESLLRLPLEEVIREAAGSRIEIARQLGAAPAAFAYPYGEFDDAVERMVAACGYSFGLSVRPGRARFHDPMLALPRIEVRGDDTLREFVLKLHAGDSL